MIWVRTSAVCGRTVVLGAGAVAGRSAITASAVATTVDAVAAIRVLVTARMWCSFRGCTHTVGYEAPAAGHGPVKLWQSLRGAAIQSSRWCVPVALAPPEDPS